MPNIILQKHLTGFAKDKIVTREGTYDIDCPSLPQCAATTLTIDTPQFDEVASLYGLTLPEIPPRNFIKAYQGVLRNSTVGRVPWYLCVPSEAFKFVLDQTVEYIQKNIIDLDTSYYDKWFLEGNYILSKLQPMKIDRNLFDKIALEEKTNKTFLSFEPKSPNDFANEIVFTRTGTVTGRLKVETGPDILLLKESSRSIIVSRFGGAGSVYSFDYRALEPRLILSDSMSDQQVVEPYHKKEPEEDIYRAIKGQLFKDNPNVTREIVKSIVLSGLYGSSVGTLIEKYPEIDSRSIVPKIFDYFGLLEHKTRLEQEAVGNHGLYINNKYGRRVSVSDASNYMLVNRYAQSTGVDIALLGFGMVQKYIEDIGKTDMIVPVGVIHDAVIFDIHESQYALIPTLRKIAALEIPKYEDTNFYMKATKFNER